MAGIDKAAIGFTIAIVAAGVGFAFYESGVQDTAPVVSTPAITSPVETKTETKQQNDPFADIVSKVKESSSMEVVEEVEETAMEVVEEVEESVTELGETVKEETEKRSPGPETFTVSMPTGTSVPGCEETNECYIPASIIIFSGDTVEWINEDTAAHTVTAGSPADGPSGVFDSSLVLGGASYSFTFNDAGSYDYFCMVHPWMVGNVQVN